MKKVTKSDINKFKKINIRIEGTLVDKYIDTPGHLNYDQVNEFNYPMLFKDKNKFRYISKFNDSNMFGDKNVIGTNSYIGDFNVFGYKNIFEAEIYIGNNNKFDEGCKFGAYTKFGNCNKFIGAIFNMHEISFGYGNQFCSCKLKNRNKYYDILNTKNPIFSICGFGSEYRKTTFILCKDDIMVSSGCFSGTINKFKKEVKKTHKDNGLFKKEYLTISDLMIKVWKELKEEEHGDY